MRQGKVFYQNDLAGIITETPDGEYTFVYNKNYIKKFPTQEITFSMQI